jgi:hypothetical protein
MKKPGEVSAGLIAMPLEPALFSVGVDIAAHQHHDEGREGRDDQNEICQLSARHETSPVLKAAGSRLSTDPALIDVKRATGYCGDGGSSSETRL